MTTLTYRVEKNEGIRSDVQGYEVIYVLRNTSCMHRLQFVQ